MTARYGWFVKYDDFNLQIRHEAIERNFWLEKWEMWSR